MTQQHYYSLVDPDNPHYALIGIDQSGVAYGTLYSDEATATDYLNGLDSPSRLVVDKMTICETSAWAARVAAKNPALNHFRVFYNDKSSSLSIGQLRIRAHQAKLDGH